MRLHNPQTGVQVNVDDQLGEQLLATGDYRNGPAPHLHDNPDDRDPNAPPKQTAAQKRAAAKTETKPTAEPAPAAAGHRGYHSQLPTPTRPPPPPRRTSWHWRRPP